MEKPLPESLELRVAVTGAFLTGHPLRIRIGNYDEVQRDLGRELERLEGMGWAVASDHWEQDGTYVSGGGFSSRLPLVIARRHGPDALARAADVLRGRPEAEHVWLANQIDGWTVELISMRMDVYDLGIGVMNGTFRVRVPTDLDLRAAARIIKRIVWLRPDSREGVYSPLTETFRTLAEETTHQFQTAITDAAPDAVQRPWLSPFLDALSRDGSDEGPRLQDWGRLLWLHPVHLLEVDDPGDLLPAATQLAPAFHQMIEVKDGHFVTGVGWSALVMAPGFGERIAPLRLTELHWAYFALYMEIDRGLLGLLDNPRWERADSLAELEADAQRVFADFIRVMEARARVETALASLGGAEQAIWDAIVAVQRFDALVEGVDRKVEVLQRVAERRVQQAAAAQARRTGAILSFLTALTIVTVTVALIGNFLGTRSDVLGHIELRVAIVLAALIASIGLYREAYRERPRRGRTRKRRLSRKPQR